jgi:hypothetical protein
MEACVTYPRGPLRQPSISQAFADLAFQLISNRQLPLNRDRRSSARRGYPLAPGSLVQILSVQVCRA